MKYERVEEAKFVMVSVFPVWFSTAFRVSKFDAVEVAPIVRTERTSAEVVPMATLSVTVCNLTRVPSSCHPETLEAFTAPQITLPEESVFRAFELEQLWIVEILKPPPETISPFSIVEVAPPATNNCPLMENVSPGVEVPTPIRPFLRMARAGEVLVE